MTLDERKVCEIKLYRDNTGRSVKMFCPINNEPPFFSGIARIRVVPAVNDATSIKEKDFEFPFPIETKTIVEAFYDFDSVCQKCIDENNTRVKTKLAESGELKLGGIKES